MPVVTLEPHFPVYKVRCKNDQCYALFAFTARDIEHDQDDTEIVKCSECGKPCREVASKKVQLTKEELKLYYDHT